MKKTNQWSRISLLLVIFILPIVSFFLLQKNQRAEEVTWSEKIGMISLVILIIILLFYLLRIEMIINSFWLWLKIILNNMSDILKQVKRKKETGDDKEGSQRPSGVPSKPSSSPSAGKIDKKQIKKKKIDKFENYDQNVEDRIRNQWERVKQRNNIKEEETELRVFAMQLKTKRYEKTDDWIWVLRNFFRARPERLQGLLFEISERIADLDEIKRTEQEKPVEPKKPKRRGTKKGKETSIPTSPSLAVCRRTQHFYN